MQGVFRYSFGLVVLIVGALFVGEEGFVEAQPNLNAQLRGDYAVNGILACVQNSDGFGLDQELLSRANTRTTAIQGILNFDGVGELTADIRSLQINHNRRFPVGDPLHFSGSEFPVSQSELTCDGTYTVNPDGTFTLDGVECSGTTVNAGVSRDLSITGIEREGHIAQGGRTLLLNHVTPDVESLTVDSSEFERICVRSGTVVKIKNR